MQTLKVPEFQAFVDHVAIRLREPVMGHGGFGIGKTESMHQLTKAKDMRLVDVRLGQYDSVDLRGFPAVDHETRTTVWHAPSTLPFKTNPHFDNDQEIMLLLDEVNACALPVAGVAMQLVNERRIGEHKLRDNVRIVCLGNRETDRGIANRMPMPFWNRLTHVEVASDHNAWCEWAIRASLPPVCVAFYQFRPELLNTFNTEKTEKVVSTPRTAEKAWKYYADPQMPDSIKHAAMAGAIGDGPAAEAWGFIKVWQHVGQLMKQIVSDPSGAAIPRQVDMQYAVAVSISGQMTTQNAGELHIYLSRMPAEFAVLAWNLAVIRDKKLFGIPAFVKFSQDYKVIHEL